MISNRRGVTRAAGLALVAVLAVLAVVLILYKLKDNKNGPGVAAVPLTGPQAKSPATKPIVVGAADAKPAAGVDRDFEIQVVDAVSKEPIARAELVINFYIHDDPKLPP